MTQTVPIIYGRYTDQPGYGNLCAACPFCGRINDMNDPLTRCPHFAAMLSAGVNQDKAHFIDPPLPIGKTPEEIQQLKRDWRHDPSWDIESSPGFEAHRDQLREYRLDMEREWEASAAAARRDRMAKAGLPDTDDNQTCRTRTTTRPAGHGRQPDLPDTDDNQKLMAHIDALEYRIEQLERRLEARE